MINTDPLWDTQRNQAQNQAQSQKVKTKKVVKLKTQL